MPKPRKGEKQTDFISRCIRQLSKEDPNRKPKQVQAICFQTWRDRKKESIDKMDEKKYDEEGNIIIAENVKLVLNAEIIPKIENKE